jgi:two-component system response regulator
MDAAPVILLVEDDSDDGELARLAFERSHVPHLLITVRDGAEALDCLFRRGRFAGSREQPAPRLVLLDLKLPGLSGFQVLQRIREDPRTKLLPVVIFSSSSEARDISESYRWGANAYLRKPVEFKQYKDLIAEVGSFWIRRNQTPQPAGVGA